MKCIYKGWCCDKTDNDECVAYVGFKCASQVSEREYQLIKDPQEKAKADYADMEHQRAK